MTMDYDYQIISGGGGGSAGGYSGGFTPQYQVITASGTISPTVTEKGQDMEDNSFYDNELVAEANELIAERRKELLEEEAARAVDAWSGFFDGFASNGFWFIKMGTLADGTEREYRYACILGANDKWYSTGRKYMNREMTEDELMRAMIGLGIMPVEVVLF